MKDRPLQPPIPDDKDANPPSDLGIWKQPPLNNLNNQEWQDAPIDEDEIETWEQTAIAPSEWQDAPVDDDEAGIWEQAAIAPSQWQDAPMDAGENELWEQTAIAPSVWQDAPVKDEEHKEGTIFLPKVVESLSYPLIPLIGYGFLGLSLFDHINIIYPVEISNPSWIVETIGQISERIPILWIGLLLVFFRREGYIRKAEIRGLKFLSWLCLLLGIIYLILIPMMIGNTVRLSQLIDTQIEARASQQTERLKRARDQVSQTKEQDISAYLRYQNSQTGLPQTITPEKFKENLLQKANKDISELTANSQALKATQVGSLVKRTVKWSLGNLLSTFVCIWVWYQTRWTRIKNLELDSRL
jgi:hypothetical protein